MSCPTCGSEYCDGEKCSENNNQDPYGPDPELDEDDEDPEEAECLPIDYATVELRLFAQLLRDDPGMLSTLGLNQMAIYGVR